MDTRAIVQVLERLAVEDNLRVAVKGSLKGGMIVGSIAAAGGLLAGPVGLAVGGAIGGCFAAVQARGQFKPVLQVLSEMSPRQRDELAARIQNVLNDIDIYDVANLLLFLNGNLSIRGRLLQVFIGYLRDDLCLQIVD